MEDGGPGDSTALVWNSSSYLRLQKVRFKLHQTKLTNFCWIGFNFIRKTG